MALLTGIKAIGKGFSNTGKRIKSLLTIPPAARPYVKHAFAIGTISLIVLLVHKEVYSFMMTQKAWRVDLSNFRARLTPSWAAQDSTPIPEASGTEATLPATGSVFDQDLVARVGESIRQNPWVKEVISVRIEYPNSVRVRIKFREPAVAIRKGRKFYLVDDEMVRLPGIYDRPPVIGKTSIPRAIGVVTFVPGEGERWDGEDVAAAVRMAGIIRDEPLFKSIAVADIDVSNLKGRQDRTKSEVSLLTSNEVRLEWGRLPRDGEQGKFIEIPLSEKISNLRMTLDAYPQLNGLKSVKLFIKNTPVIVERNLDRVGQK